MGKINITTDKSSSLIDQYEYLCERVKQTQRYYLTGRPQKAVFRLNNDRKIVQQLIDNLAVITWQTGPFFTPLRKIGNVRAGFLQIDKILQDASSNLNSSHWEAAQGSLADLQKVFEQCQQLAVKQINASAVGLS